MPQDAAQIKTKILSYMKINGPSLPVHIARQTGLSILFASAFLSELIADRELKTSNLRVGSSPLYLIPGQEPMIENYSQHLKNKEKEAFLMLKEKKFLKDRDLEPAIRVALREIKDFAVAFQRDNEIYWRYFTVPETEFPIEEIKPVSKAEVISPKEKEVIIEEEKIEIIEEEIIKPDSEKEAIGKKKPEIKKNAKHDKPLKKPRKISREKDRRNNFFNKVKEILTQKQIEILDIAEISINKIIFKVRKDEEYLIIAYNKKKVTEQDIINSHKKSQELGLPYKIMIFGEPLKRFGNLIEAVKNLKDIEKIE
ncbi:MAG: hypothetical protein PHH00_03415 [Candidatus Nanoarchaeia archaeon]|nr:hypothetical protein [Candidatus Nanoarchaeia archaeon]